MYYRGSAAAVVVYDITDEVIMTSPDQCNSTPLSTKI